MKHQVSWIPFILLLVSIVTCSPNKAHDDTVIRENYGVTFHKKGLLDNSHSVWHQTFIISLSKDQVPMPVLYCSNLPYIDHQEHYVQQLCPAIQAYNDRHYRLLKDIHTSQYNIEHMLGNLSSRSKRAPFEFLGRIAKSLFGVSTEQDTKILQSHIEQIGKLSQTNFDQITTFADNLQSFIIKSDKSTKLLERAIKLNHQTINVTQQLISQQMDSAIHDIVNMINILHTYGSQYVDILVDIRSMLQQQEQAIQSLLQGYLPYLFVPPDELVQTLQEIAETLPTYGSFKISHSEIGYYYHLNDITYQQVDNKLYIKIKIPLKTTTTSFTLYRINSVPIPLAPDRQE